MEIHSMLRRMLRYAGVLPENIEFSSDAKGALEATGRRQFDAILLNFELPDEDGFSLLHKLKALDNLAGTQFIAYIGYVERWLEAREAGFDGFLGKPLDLNRLPQQLARILRYEPVWEPR